MRKPCTEEQSRFLGIFPTGDSNSFTDEGTWSNGKFDGVGRGLRPLDPRDAFPDIPKVPLEPSIPGLPSDNPHPSPAAPEPENNLEPEPENNAPADDDIEDLPPIPRVNPAKMYYDPNSGRWILM